jgi:hypothetical protein
MFSIPLLGTNTNKIRISWFDYIWNSCIRQGWYNCWYAYKNWADLMGNNYQDYALLKDDDPLEQCILYFWDSLEEDTYPKEFLEHLLQLADDVRTGKEEIIPVDEDFFDRLKELVKDVELEED